jgi:hypothetical protein
VQACSCHLADSSCVRVGRFSACLSRLWAGRVYGTHTGNLFVKLQGQENTLSGTLRFAQDGAGVIVYNVLGSFDGARLTLTGAVATVTIPLWLAVALAVLALVAPALGCAGANRATDAEPAAQTRLLPRGVLGLRFA